MKLLESGDQKAINNLLDMNQDDDDNEAYKIGGLSHIILGSNEPISVGPQSKKTYKKTQEWNFMLLCIANNHTEVVSKLLTTEHVEIKSALVSGLFSKPYDETAEVTKAWTSKKRVKRESFALKLAIINRNEKMLKILVEETKGELFYSWNLGHIVEAIRYMIKYEWLEGLEKLFMMSKVEMLFSTLNDHMNFGVLINELITIFVEPYTDKGMTILLDQLNRPPYLLIRIFMLYYLSSGVMT